jgi:hypothetical protein
MDESMNELTNIELIRRAEAVVRPFRGSFLGRSIDPDGPQSAQTNA